MQRRRVVAAGTKLTTGIPTARAAVPVALLLVMAAEVSGPVTREKAKLQRQGY